MKMNIVTPLIEKIWNLVRVGAGIMQKEDASIVSELAEKEQEKFREIFLGIHDNVLGYMKDKESPLDRHKIAAIAMISIIEVNPLDSTEEKDTFIGNYLLATEVGLSYMLDALNELLEERGKRKIEQFYFPKAMSCETDYFRIFYRNLYFAHTNDKWNLNPLDIAERLFLLEYMTLEKNGIDPSILNEY